MRIIDLSDTLQNDKSWTPWWARNSVTYQDHKFGRFAIWLLFGITPKYLRNKLGWANDVIKLSTHGTTHMDAPWHYAPTSGGKPAKTIDQVPLEWCYGNGVVLDLRHKEDGCAITVEDLKLALEKINYQLKPFDIVLIQIGNDRRLGTREYFTHGCGVSAEATHWLIDQGIKVMGIDSWGWDVPLPVQAKQAKVTGRKDVFWAAHFVGIDKEYCQLERLVNLEQLPPHGFKVAAFPLKVKNGSAGPARVVAIIES
ncbi:cyclase family protein [Chlorogloeopsis sp. ULAP01]|uniref:cyclase family protein n=1 Tax=Chlorogloeopsis sp. ULAP01 TaxID=3056483 RepID=UPI0025AA6577|nr:cyclase family protein [Chlorogloeopsis sp. ULAP01]MDM9384787.1 cyclase family protein [Chlorogloeopsis sp. ULAP01]